MTHTEFKDQMNKLLIFYRDPAEGSEDIYWKSLHNTSAKTFERACDLILDTHKLVSFPLLPVFHDAIAQAGREVGAGDETLSSLNCPTCRGIGITLIEDKKGRSVAIPCTCSKGLTYKKSFDIVRYRVRTTQQSMMPDYGERDAPAKDPY